MNTKNEEFFNSQESENFVDLKYQQYFQIANAALDEQDFVVQSLEKQFIKNEKILAIHNTLQNLHKSLMTSVGGSGVVMYSIEPEYIEKQWVWVICVSCRQVEQTQSGFLAKLYVADSPVILERSSAVFGFSDIALNLFRRQINRENVHCDVIYRKAFLEVVEQICKDLNNKDFCFNTATLNKINPPTSIPLLKFQAHSTDKTIVFKAMSLNPQWLAENEFCLKKQYEEMKENKNSGVMEDSTVLH